MQQGGDKEQELYCLPLSSIATIFGRVSASGIACPSPALLADMVGGASSMQQYYTAGILAVLVLIQVHL